MQRVTLPTQRASLRGAEALLASRVPGRVAASRRVSVRVSASKTKVNKVVLAYSGGLDTSVILKWLQETYDCEVVTFTADLGQVGFKPAFNDMTVRSRSLGNTGVKGTRASGC
jgi:asparagine synthetase B (glutamine-hydrolysing)